MKKKNSIFFFKFWKSKINKNNFPKNIIFFYESIFLKIFFIKIIAWKMISKNIYTYIELYFF